MIHYSASIESDQIRLIDDQGNSLRIMPEEAIDHAKLQRQGSREHVCWIWRTARDAELAALMIFVGAPKPPDLVITSKGVISGRYPKKGAWHWYTLDSWLANPPPAEDVLSWVSEIRAALGLVGAEFGATPGSAICRAWIRNWHPRKQWETGFTTEEIEWQRRAVYGGRCQYQRGDHTGPIWSADIKSAYPWATTLHLPDVTSPRTDNLDHSGLAECTVDFAGMVDRVLPIQGEDGFMRWPREGTYRGVWSTDALQHAVKYGAKIIEVHRLSTWARLYRADGGLQDAIHGALEGGEVPDHIRPILKICSKALHGKWAQRRGYSRLIEHADLAHAYETRSSPEVPPMTREGEVIEEILGHWVDWAWIRVIPPDYPRHVCPVWSAQIGARVAIRLARTERLIIERGGHPIYLDTDGIHWIGQPDQVKIGAGLGKWRMEAGPIDSMKIWGSRSYVRSDGKRILAGIPREAGAALVETGSAEYSRRVTLAEIMGGETPGVRHYVIRRTPRE